ncbi:hypothetical protein [Pyxidicoccus parkwayensis]|uniref:hypothetical protein n=1 Tax=Pyxidicoccus parkwayensis TaxID=2813578 RepID=UPI001F506141|nr:hypothetical protein [Pyxidicoccus parkwaysis]
MRRLLLLLLPALALFVVAGCPLDIRVRCDESTPCATGEACVQGGCVRVDATRVGAACGSDSECGSGLTCGAGFPGGYCLQECSGGQGCPEGSVCAPDLGRCLRACGEACTRSGYACGAVPNQGGPLSACVPEVPGTDGGADGGTDGGPDALTCETDFECPAGMRCDHERCVQGLKLGEPCLDTFDCPTFAFCNKERRRCEEKCNLQAGDICEPGYRCAPDGQCVEDCTGVPETLGLTCENSLDCSRCGVCLSSGNALRCRQPCRLDRDCPGGADGACEMVGTTRACKL